MKGGATIGRWLFGCFLFSFMGVFPGAEVQASQDQPFPAYIDLSGKPGSSRHLGELNIFFPLVQDQRNLFFLNLRGQIDSKDNREFNIGLGKRHLYEHYILGGYGFFDVRVNKSGNRFYQSTIGSELLSENIDFRANGYIPFTKSRAIPVQDVQVIERPDVLNIQYSNRERALYGFDGEVGLNMGRLLPEPYQNNDAVDTRLYLGGYHFFGTRGAPGVTGPRGRIELSLTAYDWSDYVPDGTQLMLGLEAQYDEPRDGQVFGLFRLRIPLHKGPRKRLTGLQRRMVAPLVRDVDIVTANAVTTEPALLASPGGEDREVRGIAVVTNSAQLFDATTNGQPGQLIVVDENIETSLDNYMQPGQSLNSGGNEVDLKTASGVQVRYTLPGTSDGQPRTITKTRSGIGLVGAAIVPSLTSQIQNIQVRTTQIDGSVVSTSLVLASPRDGSLGYWFADGNNSEVGQVRAFNIGGDEPITYSIRCADPDGNDLMPCAGLSIDRDTGVITTTALPPQQQQTVLAEASAGGSTASSLIIVASQAAVDAARAVTEEGGTLPNRGTSNDIILLYGNDFRCSSDDGVFGQVAPAADACNPTGETKIDSVRDIIGALLRHDNTHNGGRIQNALARNQATLVLYDTFEDRDESAAVFLIYQNAQDLQADETFIDGHNNLGRNQAGDKRNAAVEEIVHLIHNYGITYAYPEIQTRLDVITDQAFEEGFLNFVDDDGDGAADPPGDLPRSDLDDEYFADGVEAYFNLRGGSGYTFTDNLCSSGGVHRGTVCAGERTSRSDLRTHHRPLYDLIEEVFGPRQTFFGQ